MMQQVNLLVDELKPVEEALAFRQLMMAWGAFDCCSFCFPAGRAWISGS